MRIKWIIAVAVLQVAGPGIPWLVNASGCCARGRTIYIRSASSGTPATRMRGDYLRVTSTCRTCLAKLCRGDWASTNGTFATVRPDTRVYATLRDHGGRDSRLNLSSERPSEVVHAWAHGRVLGEHLWCGMVSRPFFSSKTGRELEQVPDREAVRVPLE